MFRRRDNLVRHLKNLHPESPMVVSMRQTDDKEPDEQQEKKNHGGETCSPSISSVGQAVSVIRTVPVIQKVGQLYPVLSVFKFHLSFIFFGVIFSIMFYFSD